MGLLVLCCPRALVTNITELTITSYAWMRTAEEQAVVTEPSKKCSKHPNIERMIRAEWDIRHIRESITESGEGGYCIVCFDSFEHVKESKLIPCGHKEICPKCAIRLISMRGKNTTCPQCRHIVWKYVVIEDDMKSKPNKNTIILEDYEERSSTDDKSNDTSSTEKVQIGSEKSQHKKGRQDRHCNVCFRPFFHKKEAYSTSTPSPEQKIRVRESRLYPCGHEDICVICAGLITMKEINRECPQCRRFVRRFINVEQTESGP